MAKRKTVEASFISAAEWIRRLAEETAAFEVAKIVEKEPHRGNSQETEWDHVITVSTKPDKRRVDLFVETRQQLSPVTALNVFQKLRWLPPDGVLVICAPYISPRVADLCREQNVGYLDRVGNCRIAAPGLFVQISGRANRQATITATVDPFSRKSSRIVRTLLTYPDKGWQVQQLAQQADVTWPSTPARSNRKPTSPSARSWLTPGINKPPTCRIGFIAASRAHPFR